MPYPPVDTSTRRIDLLLDTYQTMSAIDITINRNYTMVRGIFLSSARPLAACAEYSCRPLACWPRVRNILVVPLPVGRVRGIFLSSARPLA
eukprot:1182066-Prorocentrum_minimum.AAC.1